jgi:antitoxin ParD1/3/4
VTVKTTLSFTDRHHRFLADQVEKGVFATTSAGVAVAVEQLMLDEEARLAMLSALAEEIRARAATSREAYLDEDAAFAAVLDDLASEE